MSQTLERTSRVTAFACLSKTVLTTISNFKGTNLYKEEVIRQLTQVLIDWEYPLSFFLLFIGIEQQRDDMKAGRKQSCGRFETGPLH